MKLNKILITLVLLSLAGAAIGPFIQFSNGALNPFTAAWDTTTAFDGGTKVGIDSATNSCLASGQGIQLNATGGNYGVSQRCPTGSPYISSTNLSASYSFDSKMPNGDFADYSKNAKSMQPTGTVTDVAGKIGRGVWIGSGSSGMFNFATTGSNDGFFRGTNLNKATFAFFVNANMSDCGGGVCTLFSDNGNQGSSSGFIWTYLFAPSAGVSAINFQYYGNGATRVATLNSVTANSWHSVVIRVNYTDGVVVTSVDGTPLKVSLVTPAIAPTVVGRSLLIGFYTTSSNSLKASLDNIVISSRWWSDSEVSAFSGTFGYSGFGSWTSPKVQTTNQTPVAVTLGYHNVSGSESFGPWISGFSIFNSTTGLEFDSPGVMSTGTYNITYFTVSVFSNGSQIVPRGNLNWTIEIDLQGDGNATAQLFYAAIIFQSLPIPTVTPKFAPTLDSTAIAILLLIFAFVFLFLTGFLERFLMVSAAIVAYIIGILSWTWTGQPFIPAIFVLVGTACIGLAMVIKPRQK